MNMGCTLQYKDTLYNYKHNLQLYLLFSLFVGENNNKKKMIVRAAVNYN